MNKPMIEALVQRWIHAVTVGPPEAFDPLLTEDVVDESAASPSQGSETFKVRAEAVRKAMSGLSLSVDSLVIDGDAIAWRWTLTGTTTAAGERAVIRGANFQTLRDGRVSKHWSIRS